VSDAGAPLQATELRSIKKLVGASRQTLDIILERVRNDTSESFRFVVNTDPTRGALITLRSPVSSLKGAWAKGTWPPGHPALIGTSLKPLTSPEFIAVEAHGYECARQGLLQP